MSITKNKVSIIVPVYNAEQFLSGCIESLLRQTYPLIEIVMVNDGSTDHSYELCKKYQKHADHITVIDKRNEGVTLARLRGVKESTGEYIAFVDADDWIDDDYIERMLKELEDGDIILAGISRIIVEENNRVLEEKNKLPRGRYEKEQERMELFKRMLSFQMPFQSGILPYACNKIYKKEKLIPLMEAVDKRIYDGEDVAIIFPYLLESKKIVLSDYCGYWYRIHKDSACMKKRSDAYKNASLLYIWLYSAFEKSPYADFIFSQLQNYFLRMIWKYDPGIYLETNEFVFPFSKVDKGSDIIIYGTGDVGRAYYIQVQQTEYCNIVAWADKNVKYSEWKNCALISPQEIKMKTFDYIIVAIRSEYIGKKVYHDLISLGIEKNKIILCDAGVEKSEL